MRIRKLFFLLSLASASALADSITFKTGGNLEGIIVNETAAEVTIKNGPGTATFKKSQLRSILHDAAANAEMQHDWQNQYFANPEFLPANMRSFAQDFRDLLNLQSAALRAQKQIHPQQDEAVRTETEMRGLQRREIEIAAQLQKVNPVSDPEAYNRLVRAGNETVSRFTLLQNHRQQLAALDTTNRVAVSAYMTALVNFRDAFETAHTRPITDEPTRIFFTKAGDQLAAMNAGLQEVKIPVTDTTHGHALVTARINDRDDARLLVDTGASLVTLSAASAARLHLTWDAKQKMKMQLADGSQIDVHPVTLGSLTIAGTRLDNVAAVIIPAAPSADIDGLLGMSYLREFDIQLDPARGQIVLRRLPPAN